MSESVRLSPLVCRGLCFGTGWLLVNSSAASASQLLRQPVDAPLRGSEVVTVVSTLVESGAGSVCALRLLSWQVHISTECLTQCVSAVGSRWKDWESCAH